ncbi:hypothetical protein KQX54_008837 [Cotesia glomerata]|uniref:Uncharacterized protein n=1 Tax=Cotesia glomerata TaxID=32391 RepID=A0AAV7IM39_COTGL|nr:hypothetical protein KQX54_008837 [Cotesia glomerata]
MDSRSATSDNCDQKGKSSSRDMRLSSCTRFFGVCSEETEAPTIQLLSHKYPETLRIPSRVGSFLHTTVSTVLSGSVVPSMPSEYFLASTSQVELQKFLSASILSYPIRGIDSQFFQEP